jgi:hypothetical protein
VRQRGSPTPTRIRATGSFSTPAAQPLDLFVTSVRALLAATRDAIVPKAGVRQRPIVIDKLLVPFLVSLSGGNGGEETPRLAELFAKQPQPLPCAVCGFGNSLAYVHTLSSDGLRAGRAAVGLRYEQQEIDRYSDAQLLSFAQQDVDAHSYDRRMALRLGGYYGITDSISVGVDLPWVDNVGLREAVPGVSPDVENNGSQSGLGDASLFTQWTVHRDAASGQSASLYAGAKLPTGETHKKSSGGDRLEPDHQLGSGSVNPLLGASVGQSVGNLMLTASAMYEFATEGTLSSNLGDIVRLNCGFGWSPEAMKEGSLRWTFLLEAVGEWRERAEIDGATDQNTGGSQLFVAPGVRATWNESWSSYASLSLPVVEDLNGEQADTDLRFTAGFALLF